MGPSDTVLPRIVRWLREADERLPVSRILSGVGVGLVAVGVCCGTCSIVLAYPWLISLLVGLMCLAAAAVAHRGGMVTLLPASMQDSLLQKTPFDLLIDDTKAHSFTRRWGRVLLLSSARSESEVYAISQGVDRAFLDMVFRQSSVHMLPGICRSLLLPRGLDPQPAVLEQSNAIIAPCSSVMPGRGRWWLGGLGYLLAAHAKSPPVEDGSCGGGIRPALDITPAGIHTLLRQKAEIRQQRQVVGDPALGPVLCKLVPIALNRVVPQFLQLAAYTSMISSGACIISALFFCTPFAHTFLRFYAVGGKGSPASRRAASRIAVAACTLSLFGALSSFALAHGIRRRWLRKTLAAGETVAPHGVERAAVVSGSSSMMTEQCAHAMEGVPSEPEREASPDNTSEEDETPR